MRKETIDFGHERIEVSKDGNLIYINLFGEYTNDDAISITIYN